MSSVNSSIALALEVLDIKSTAVDSLLTQPGLLGRVTFGLKHGMPSNDSAIHPCQHLYAPQLGAVDNSFDELWLSSKPVHLVQEAGLAYRHDGDILIGVVEIQEPQIAEQESAHALQIAAEQAYLKLFDVLDRSGYRYLWRAWNYMADINGMSKGLERYRQFNLGRQQGFMHSKRSVTGNVPAACAIGVAHGPLSVMFLAGREPTAPFENPRQVAAYDYPKEYGPRSPTFSRASLAKLRDQELLFLSGTASIVGHETLYTGNVQLQTLETLKNIEAVLEVANHRRQAPKPYALEDFALRVYLRHPKDYSVVHQLLSERLGASHRGLYLQADICRADLAVEIEGVASQSLASAQN